ncbi:putative leucine-rich repeat-containing protein DDB_G0290503 isoform X1 [Cotesia glomerata]|uniref:putative leucine-rich repeat-containing protein DDB_G0290503 isoform X1 n=1 Tax=Cotesia glomerata TaxID=32391 RepID=UPI001D007316|nr:putative leucine-rich repeat-containing protein DDB_G0290503 isoform X1 [Cotesia glomerata]
MQSNSGNNVTFNDNNSACQAKDSDTGIACEETTSLEILNEFKKVYEKRIASIDPSDVNKSEHKIKIMTEWIKDLDAQNTMLVRTIEELEEAACCRVKMLEEKLKHTSFVLSENMSGYSKPSQQNLNELTDRINQLERDEKILQQRIQYLQSDIRGLLELIRRAQVENCWRLDGINFFEIRPSDIPLSSDCAYDQVNGWSNTDKKAMKEDYKTIEFTKNRLHFDKNRKKSLEYPEELEKKVDYLNKKLKNRDKVIHKSVCKFQVLKESLLNNSTVNPEFKDDIIKVLDTVKNELIDEKYIENLQDKALSDSTVQIDNNVDSLKLKNQLDEKMREISRLNHQLNCLEKESVESREALTVEVAEKHDLIMNLKDQVTYLEEQFRQANIQLQFKNNIIKEMRKDLVSKNALSGTPRKVNSNALAEKISWSDDMSDEGSNKNGAKDKLLLNILSFKSTSKEEYRVIMDTKKELGNILNFINEMEKKKNQVTERVNENNSDVVSETKIEYTNLDEYNNELINNADKLTQIITTLSKLCIDKNEGFLQLEFALQGIHEKNERLSHLELNEKILDIPEINRQQFNAMEEFRICTVCAQAATEDLREEMSNVICNLYCRHQLFVDLGKSIRKTNEVVSKAKENLSTVIKYLQVQVEEKTVNKNTIAAREIKLKDIKNEVNETRAKFISSTTDEHQQRENCENETANTDAEICDRLLNKAIDEVDYILCNLGIFISKEDYAVILLTGLNDQLQCVEENLAELSSHIDRVLQDNEAAQVTFDEKGKRLDKLERELDYAHTKMQEALESIVSISQQHDNENSSDNSNNSINNENDKIVSNEDKEYLQSTSRDNDELDQLKNSLCSKDKLLEHKEEIIRIQKNSIEMTRDELQSLHQRLQSKVDEQTAVINQYWQDRNNLLEQTKLQNQTIKHLQDAIVKAKKNLNRQQQPQKSTIDLTVGDVWSPITPTVFNNDDVHDI